MNVMNCFKNVCLVCLLALCTMVVGVESVSASPNIVLGDDGSTSIVATVSDSSEFTITPKNEGGLNCINDYTSWSFDFTGVEFGSNFSTTISQANLELKVVPQNIEFDNDRVQVEGLSWIGGITPESFVIGTEKTLSVDLLAAQNYSSTNLMSKLKAKNKQLPFRYEDDACVEVATLELVFACPDL